MKGKISMEKSQSSIQGLVDAVIQATSSVENATQKSQNVGLLIRWLRSRHVDIEFPFGAFVAKNITNKDYTKVLEEILLYVKQTAISEKQEIGAIGTKKPKYDSSLMP